MPAKHLRGVGAKEQREYEHIKESAERFRALRQQGKGSSRPDSHETAQRKGSQRREIVRNSVEGVFVRAKARGSNDGVRNRYVKPERLSQWSVFF